MHHRMLLHSVFKSETLGEMLEKVREREQEKERELKRCPLAPAQAHLCDECARVRAVTSARASGWAGASA